MPADPTDVLNLSNCPSCGAFLTHGHDCEASRLGIRATMAPTDQGKHVFGWECRGTFFLGQQGEAQARAYARGMAGDNGST